MRDIWNFMRGESQQLREKLAHETENYRSEIMRKADLDQTKDSDELLRADVNSIMERLRDLEHDHRSDIQLFVQNSEVERIKKSMDDLRDEILDNVEVAKKWPLSRTVDYNAKLPPSAAGVLGTKASPRTPRRPHRLEPVLGQPTPL